MADPRDQFIKMVVSGKTFADLGGLWGTVNEKISVAHQAGATRLTMIDRITPAEEEWRLFDEHRRQLGVPEVECISKDILALADTAPCPQFDVVNCGGVLYHIPDPMRLLTTLRKITREYLVLTSIVTQTKVNSAAGTLDVPEGSAIFVPALRGRELEIVKSYWQRLVGEGAIGLTRETQTWKEDNYVPWWWLPTVGTLQAMATTAGFKFLEGGPFWDGNAYTLLLKVEDNCGQSA